MMIETAKILTLADIYGQSAHLARSTVSTRVFGDGKKLDAVAAGRDITVSRFNAALAWFADNWPADLDWPSDIPRPSPVQEETT